MNANPYFRYYAATALILLLILMMRVQAHPGQSTPAAQPVSVPGPAIAQQPVR